MKNLGLMSFFFGMEIKQAEYEIFICRKKHVMEVLKKFKFENTRKQTLL